jgi:predicted Fe-Mo cluster-binding NifX family protein
MQSWQNATPSKCFPAGLRGFWRWHIDCVKPGVTIAIPVSQARISPVLDSATRMLLVTRRRGKEVARREVALAPRPAETLAGYLAELRVGVLLCAALSEALRRALERAGIRVRPHLCGEVEAILRALDRGQLRRDEFRMPGCGGHGDNWCGARFRNGRRGKGGAARRLARNERTGP